MKEVDIEGVKITVQEHDHVNMVNSQKWITNVFE